MTVLNLLVPATFYRPELETVYYAINYTLIALMAIAAIAAIVLVMLQPGNSQGIDALGGTSETFYGKNKGRSLESKLKMWTIICLAVLCSSLAFSLWVSTIKSLGVAKSSIFSALIPVVSAIAACLLGQEDLNLRQFIGIAISAVGVVLSQYTGKEGRAKAA